MKLLALSHDYPPIAGGIAAHVYELYQAMATQEHRIDLVTKPMSGQAPRRRDGNVNILPLPPLPPLPFLPRAILRPLYGRRINAMLNRLIADLKPDILHLHGILPLHGLTAKPVPIVFTNHSSGYLQRLAKGGRHIRRLERLFAPIDLLLAPSEELLHTPFNITAKKHFIPNGVVAERFAHDPQARARLRATLGIADDEILAIATRRLVPKNGVLYLAQAMRHIRHPKLKLLIIGDGTEYNAIARELTQHFGGRFIMTGAMTHAQIVPYYSAADLSVLPSLMEATSISCLEAMAARLPIIATHVGGLPTLVREGTNGLLCRPADPQDLAATIETLLAQDLSALGDASHKRVIAHFTWENIARQTLSAYKQAL